LPCRQLQDNKAHLDANSAGKLCKLQHLQLFGVVPLLFDKALTASFSVNLFKQLRERYTWVDRSRKQ
jgi:hypothetical protein